MELNEITIYAVCLREFMDSLGYVTYVFEDLKFSDPDFRYIMCVKFPNWNNPTFYPGDKGYLNIRYIQAGKDKWFNGKDFVPYNYTNIQFLKFIPEKVKPNNSELVLD